MKTLNVIGMKHELASLIHIRNTVRDFTSSMSDPVLSLDYSYFREICRDFYNLVNDSPYITRYLKDSCKDVLMNDIKTEGNLYSQGQELRGFQNFVTASASHVRKCIYKDIKED